METVIIIVLTVLLTLVTLLCIKLVNIATEARNTASNAIEVIMHYISEVDSASKIITVVSQMEVASDDPQVKYVVNTINALSDRMKELASQSLNIETSDENDNA